MPGSESVPDPRGAVGKGSEALQLLETKLKAKKEYYQGICEREHARIAELRYAELRKLMERSDFEARLSDHAVLEPLRELDAKLATLRGILASLAPMYFRELEKRPPFDK